MMEVSENFSETMAPDLATEATWRRLPPPTTSPRRLKTLNGLTPYEFVCKRWSVEPERFTLNPLQQTLGLNT